ncbi:hypothetical protein ACWY4P_53415 (plasmid) [Streptomyces sp. LZ34]
MTTQTPMTAEEVFAGYDFRTNQGREGAEFFFNGHLTPDQIAETYYATYPEHRTEFPYAVDTASVRHTWHLFTAHEDDCYLIAEDHPSDPFEPDDFFDSALCSCAANAGLEDGPGYEHRHPHPAAPEQPGAVAVTWVTIHPA